MSRVPRRRHPPRILSAAYPSSRRLHLCRKHEIKTGATRLVSAITQPRIVRLDDRSTDGQTQSGAGGLGREEGFENLLLDFAGESGPQITHGDLDITGLRGSRCDAHFEGCPVRCAAHELVSLSFERIVHEVHENLLNLYAVDRHRGQGSRQVELQAPIV